MCNKKCHATTHGAMRHIQDLNKVRKMKKGYIYYCSEHSIDTYHITHKKRADAIIEFNRK
jgi:cAMP phosphodiesterase